MEKQDKLISLDELCNLLGVRRSYIYKLTSRNELPFFKVGGLKFSMSEIQKWLETKKHKVRKSKSLKELIE